MAIASGTAEANSSSEPHAIAVPCAAAYRSTSVPEASGRGMARTRSI